MKIDRRYGGEWVKQENKDKKYCDECKRALWQAPHGGIYCNTENCGMDYAVFKEGAKPPAYIKSNS